MFRFAILLFITLFNAQFINAQNKALLFEEYEPVSTLKVKETPLVRAKFPFIDVHNHQFNMVNQDLNALTLEMDRLNMAVMVNLSGRGFNRRRNADGSQSFALGRPENLRKVMANVNANASNRIIVFTNVDFSGIDDPEWTENRVKQLEEDVRSGAKGLKIYKGLGLEVVDSKGNRVHTDDPRIDAIWAKCGELGIPVLIHTGEPIAFFDKHDKFNERWLELKQYPNRARPSDRYPSWLEIMQEQWNVFEKHPSTLFVSAHFGWMANDLGAMGKLLDKYPNVYTETAAVIHELGRQPRTAKAFFEKYQDKILFGKDIWKPSEYQTYMRVLETEDEYIPYFRKRHAFWRLYGLGLSDDVLRKIYYKNALKIIPGIEASLFEGLEN